MTPPTDEARAMGRCYVHAEPLTYTGAMCPVCASEAPSSDEQTIARLRQALAVATHRPHDRNGPPDPPSGWPTCSGCGAIIDPSSAVGTEAQAPVSPIGDTVREYSAERRRRASTMTDEARAGEPRPLPCAFCDSPDGSKWHRPSCVEAAAAPSLDPDVLAESLDIAFVMRHRIDGTDWKGDLEEVAKVAVVEYQRLSEKAP